MKRVDVAQLAERGEAAFEETLQFAPARPPAPARARGAAASPRPACAAHAQTQPTRAIRSIWCARSRGSPTSRYARAYRAASSLRRRPPSVSSTCAMRRSNACVSSAQFDRIGDGVQQRRRQQALHHRQHAGDVGVAPAEVVVVVDVAEEELRRGPAARIAQEAVETALPAAPPASAAVPAASAGRCAVRGRIVQRLVLPSRQPSAERAMAESVVARAGRAGR